MGGEVESDLTESNIFDVVDLIGPKGFRHPRSVAEPSTLYGRGLVTEWEDRLLLHQRSDRRGLCETAKRRIGWPRVMHELGFHRLWSRWCFGAWQITVY